MDAQDNNPPNQLSDITPGQAAEPPSAAPSADETPAAKPPKRWRSKKVLLGAAVVAVLAIGIGSYFGLVKKSPADQTASTKVYRVGVLCGLEFFCKTQDGFKAGMTELGYIEGKNIIYDFQKTNFEPDKEKAILAKFVQDKVDLIVTYPTEVSLAAKAAIAGTSIPLLFDTAFIEGVNLINSIPEPGNNLTGVRYPGPDLAVKRLEIMLEIAPNTKRVLVAYQKGYPIVAPELETLKPAASSKGVTLVEFPANNAAELQTYLDKLPKTGDVGFDAILMISEPLAVSPDAFPMLGKFATEHKLPLGGAFMSMAGYDTIFGVDIDSVAAGKQAAPLADKILKGSPAGNIPVLTAESFFQLNNKAATAQGITLSESLLDRADQVVK